MNADDDCSRAAKRCLVLVSALLLCAASGVAAELKQARVTQVVKDVKLLPETAAPRPASINDTVRDGTAVRTGTESRTELTFTDQTLARLGANSIFSFAEGTRNLELKDGAMLLRVPKNSGGARINTAAITAAITGTTVMIETHPVTSKTKGGFYKFIVLEGTARLFLPGRIGESVLVHAGQMIIMRHDGKKIPNPVDVDIAKIMQSSLLIQGFPPLPSAGLIALQEQQQVSLKSSGQLYETNLVIFGGGINVNLTDPTNTDVVSVASVSQGSSSPPPTPPPSPPPSPPPASKFGALTTIVSPAPYQINNGTQITTDPSITTNGITSSGKIYRSPVDDGAPSAYFFGSTSAFDTASGFDSLTADAAGLPLAVFKFQSLQLSGSPSIDTSNGPSSLALIASNSITSAAPGGVWSFPGLQKLFFATESGSITLGSEISFQNIPGLAFYARGSGSDLTLSSDISGATDTILGAQRNVNVDGTTLGSQSLTVIAGTNINMGLSAPVTITGSDASLLIPNSGTGNIPGNSTITLNPAGNLTLNGANGLALTMDNSNGGHIGGAAKISLNTAALAAGSLNLFINNRNGGSIGSFADVTCNILGDLTIAGDANIGTSNRNDGVGGGTMGTDSTVTVQANSISVGGLLTGFVSANAGGRIGNVGLLQLSATGDIHSGAGTSLLVQSTGFNVAGGPFIAPGFIGSDALLTVTAANLTSDGFIDAEVGEASGHIGGNAQLNFNINGTISSPDTFFLVGGAGGQIGGDASLVVNAGSISASNTQIFQIANANGGNISGNASLNIGVTGGISAPDVEFFLGNRAGQIGGNASMVVNAGSISASTTGPFFQIVNPNAGAIGGNATMDVTTSNLSGNLLFVAILNSVNDGTPNGTIASNATINFNLSGTSTVATDATFQINGSDSAGSAAINLNGGTYNVGGTFEGFMDGSGTMTFNNATINADTIKAGVFGAKGTLRIGGGSMSANTLLHLYATGSNGLIDFVSNVTLSSSGSAPVIAANTVTVENGVVVTIAGQTPANVYANVPNYAGSGGNGSTRGTFGGAGATTQPLSQTPPFVVAAARHNAKTQSTSTTTSGSKRIGFQVADTSQLGSLLNNAAPGRDGKVRVPAATRGKTSTQNTIPSATQFHRSAETKSKSGAPALVQNRLN